MQTFDMTAARALVVRAINTERRFQDDKYGPVQQWSMAPFGEGITMVQGPGGHELAAWLLIIEAELAEAKKAAIHGGYANAAGRDSIRAEIIQIAAVCVAALEQHGVEEVLL